MPTADRRFTLVLVIAAGFLWIHDRAWLRAPEDALPLLVGLPLFAWLAAPWRWSSAPFRLHRGWLAIAGLIAVLGLITQLNILLALAWTATLWSWLRSRLPTDHRVRAARLLPLAVLAFPWLTLDFPALGWWCRLSAAVSAEHCFQFLGFAVRREGTQLLVAQMPFDVTPACSGIKALQALLIAGITLCFIQCGQSRRYWFGVACLPLVAWLANVVRVQAIVVAALSFGPEFASGWFHSVGGWMAIAALFGLLGWGLEMARERNPIRIAP